MRSRAFRVVDEFEAALCEFTGAPHAVTVDSCTNALMLAFRYWRESQRAVFGQIVTIPKHTYVGVVQAARNAGLSFRLVDLEWRGFYYVGGTNVVDAAKFFERNMYGEFLDDTLACVSFQAGKLLPIGRGGAILTDNEDAAEWLRRARLDGRTAGADYTDPTFQKIGFHCYMPPPDAARGLWLMTYIDDNDQRDWTEYPDLSEATWV